MTETYPAMNTKIVELLRWDKDNPVRLYAAQRILELEVQVERLHTSMEEILDEATSDLDRDIIITECQSALAVEKTE